ncbi:MAG TPA: hypothetical protein VGN89_00535, partial [Phenylobacterium sp.]|nr:hypothetical protein [Phenylobacterium sp.]
KGSLLFLDAHLDRLFWRLDRIALDVGMSPERLTLEIRRTLAVERSTGFAAPERAPAPPLTDDLKRIADQARPHYEALARYRLS